LVDGTWSDARGSMVTAVRNDRARALKQDSTMW
jgi:hypothetical protein